MAEMKSARNRKIFVDIAEGARGDTVARHHRIDKSRVYAIVHAEARRLGINARGYEAIRLAWNRRSKSNRKEPIG